MSSSDSDSDSSIILDSSDDEGFIIISEESSRKVYKSRVDQMVQLSDGDFTYRFRLNKSSVQILLTEIYPLLKVTSTRNHGISPVNQVLLTLRFYALGTMLVSVADYVGVSKSSASRIVADVSAAIAKLYPSYVYMRSNTQQDFYNIRHFPRVLGAIDGTHVLMQSPSKK